MNYIFVNKNKRNTYKILCKYFKTNYFDFFVVNNLFNAKTFQIEQRLLYLILVMNQDLLLNKYNYPQEKIKRVKNCVLHHRTSFDAENKEEVCVSDADILSHFDNIPMIFDYAYKNYDVNLSNIRSFIKRYFENDYNDLSDKTKVIFKEEYENIMNVLFK